MTTPKDHRLDKLALFILAGISITGLVGIGAGILWWGMPTRGEGAEGLLNVVATGLLLFAREIVGSIRSAWQDQQVGSLSDKLHGSVPAKQPPPVPEDAADAARQTADAADERASEIEEEAKP